MKASTLFALTLALLVGLGVTVMARLAGWFSKPPEPAPKKIDPPTVLVAGRNIFAGDLIDNTWVRTRPLRPGEQAHYDSHKDQYLPPVVEAAVLRVTRKNLEADTPILREHLEELAKPTALHQRLMPNTRAVNVAGFKDQVAGGLIQVGEWVDVYLTTQIDTDDKVAVTRTAPIAHKLRVITKRNALWNIFAGLPDDKPVHFTLEANPYRASLIEFCKTKGNLSLEPLSAAEQASLEAQRNQVLKAGPNGDFKPVAFNNTNLGDYEEEESRVLALNRGEYTVGTADLIRIFDLKTPAPPLAQVKVDQFHGTQRLGTSRWNSEGELLEVPNGRGGSNATAAAASHPGFRFSLPDYSNAKTCKTCGKKKN
jgi:Flp pilus assembly protein CpaB